MLRCGVLPALSEQAIFDEVVVTPRRGFPRLPELHVIERPGWLQIITPLIRNGALNEVIFSELDEQHADAIIDATIAEYRAAGLKFRWYVGPGSAPADLGKRLERRGLVASWGRGMARSTSSPPGAGGPAIRVAEVEATNVDVFSQVMAGGWGIELPALAAINALIVAAPDRPQRLFLATCDGEPAATASYIAFPRSAFLNGGVVLPQYRGRGLYRALVRARLVHASSRGIELATSHAREATAAPILEHMGFETICRFPMYMG